MRYRLQRHDGTDCSATMVPITVLRMVPIQRYRQFAQLGGYSLTTFRRIFDTIFHVPVHEWMTEQRKESILYQLRNDRLSISEICFGHGFESLSNFSNFCKKYFGDSPRNLRKGKSAEIQEILQ